MNRKLLFTLLLSVCCLGVMAQPQELISSSGATYQNSSGYLSFSIGEVITATLTSPSAVLTQGFLQGLVFHQNPVENTSLIQMSVFPNPVKDILTLQVEMPDGFEYRLYDSKGVLLDGGQVLDERMEINFSSLSPAIYLLQVTNQKETRLFQIVKY